MFIGIQHSHVIAVDGYDHYPVGTGYENVLADRTSDLYAATAKQSGKVLEVGNNYVRVQLEDGTEVAYETGTRYGKADGVIIPHQVVPNVKAGDKFEAGDCIVYNKGFFKPDRFDPKAVRWMAGLTARTVFMETPDTLEDSSVISESLAERLASKFTYTRDVFVDFKQAILNVSKVGQTVDADSILCTITDNYDSESDLFDEKSLDTLKWLSNNSPRAKHHGVIERIEVLYNGETEDMSSSLAAITRTSDRHLLRLRKALGKPEVTGRVDSGIKIGRTPLELEQAVVRFYITASVPAGKGD